MTNKFIVVAITRDEARVWRSGLEPKTHPELIHPPEDRILHHVRTAEFRGGHYSDLPSPEYYESISQAMKGAERILLVGHGKGKASAALRLTQYLERKHPDQAMQVVDSLDTDLLNLSEGEILALARNWVAAHPA